MTYRLKMFGNRRFACWSLPLLVTSLALIVAAFLGAWLQPPVPNPFEPIGTSVLNWLRYPIERNAHLRLPFISGHLSSITFAGDWRTGWGVGSDGTILKTEDGGATWKPRPSGTSVWLESVTFAADGKTGWIVGQEGAVLKTRDGGDTWEPRSSGTTDWLESVSFTADGKLGWDRGVAHHPFHA